MRFSQKAAAAVAAAAVLVAAVRIDDDEPNEAALPKAAAGPALTAWPATDSVLEGGTRLVSEPENPRSSKDNETSNASSNATALSSGNSSEEAEELPYYKNQVANDTAHE